MAATGVKAGVQLRPRVRRPRLPPASSSIMWEELGSEAIPRKLFRVYWNESSTPYDDKVGFTARGVGVPDNIDLISPDSLGKMILDHLDWSCRSPSSFISTFKSLDKAKQRARQLAENPLYLCTDIRIAEIDVSTLDTYGIHVFRALFAIYILCLEGRVLTKQSSPEEYLCWKYVPREAITQQWRYNPGETPEFGLIPEIEKAALEEIHTEEEKPTGTEEYTKEEIPTNEEILTDEEGSYITDFESNDGLSYCHSDDAYDSYDEVCQNNLDDVDDVMNEYNLRDY